MKENFKPYYKLSTKDLAQLSDMSIRSAERLKSDIKKVFNIQIVRYKHFLKYFEISEL